LLSFCESYKMIYSFLKTFIYHTLIIWDFIVVIPYLYFVYPEQTRPLHFLPIRFSLFPPLSSGRFY
jgi:hypothetical protein